MKRPIALLLLLLSAAFAVTIELPEIAASKGGTVFIPVVFKDIQQPVGGVDLALKYLEGSLEILEVKSPIPGAVVQYQETPNGLAISAVFPQGVASSGELLKIKAKVSQRTPLKMTYAAVYSSRGTELAVESTDGLISVKTSLPVIPIAGVMVAAAVIGGFLWKKGR